MKSKLRPILRVMCTARVQVLGVTMALMCSGCLLQVPSEEDAEQIESSEQAIVFGGGDPGDYSSKCFEYVCDHDRYVRTIGCKFGTPSPAAASRDCAEDCGESCDVQRLGEERHEPRRPTRPTVLDYRSKPTVVGFP